MLLYRLKDSTVSVYQNAKKKTTVTKETTSHIFEQALLFSFFHSFERQHKERSTCVREREREGEKYEKNHKADALILFVPYK